MRTQRHLGMRWLANAAFCIHIPAWCFEVLVFRLHDESRIHGLSVVDCVEISLPDGVPFHALVDKALVGIRDASPVIWRRVLKHIRRVAHLPSETGAEYSLLSRTCSIDLRVFPPADRSQELLVAFITIALVHEATHGHLRRKGFLQHSRIYGRLELACMSPCRRLFRKLGRGLLDFELSDAMTNPPRLIERLRFVANEALRPGEL